MSLDHLMQLLALVKEFIHAHQIAIVYLLLVASLVSFVWERIPADVTALTLMAVLLVESVGWLIQGTLASGR